MLFRVLCFLVLLGAFSGAAEACRYQARPLADSVKDAQVAFIGTVRTVENGQATLVVEQVVRGVTAGQEVTADDEGSSCDIRFSAGSGGCIWGRCIRRDRCCCKTKMEMNCRTT